LPVLLFLLSVSSRTAEEMPEGTGALQTGSGHQWLNYVYLVKSGIGYEEIRNEL